MQDKDSNAIRFIKRIENVTICYLKSDIRSITVAAPSRSHIIQKTRQQFHGLKDCTRILNLTDGK